MTYPEVGGSKSVTGGDGGGGSGVCIESVNVSQQGTHDRRNTRRHVLGGQTRKVPEMERNIFCT